MLAQSLEGVVQLRMRAGSSKTRTKGQAASPCHEHTGISRSCWLFPQTSLMSACVLDAHPQGIRSEGKCS